MMLGKARCSFVIAGFLFAGTLCSSGCGGSDGPQRYELSGRVTYNDQPVPGGEIIFAPDTSKENSGPGSFAIIKDGRYETFDGKGLVAGPHRVTIIGYSVAPGPGVPESQVRELFSPYETTIDLPSEGGEQDFDVPTPTR